MDEKADARLSSGSDLTLTSTESTIMHDHTQLGEKDLEANVAHSAAAAFVAESPAPDLQCPPLEPTVSSIERGLAGALSRTLSRVRTKDSLDAGPAPDGGRTAWTTVLLCHLVIFNTWGFINSFGLFQTYYTTELNIGSASAVSWIGSVQVFLLFALGTFSGRATDAGYFKLTFAVGSAVQLLGVFMTSISRTYTHIFLSQGICVGVGNGLVFIPAVAVTATYFLRHRGVAIGLAAAGSATGGLVFPAIAETLLPAVGFGWTVRVMGFVQLVVSVVCAVCIRPRLPPRKSGPIVEWAAFREPSYTLYCAGAFFFFWGVYIGFYFVGSFAKQVLGTPQSTSISLLLTMNGVGLPGRIIPNYWADRKFGPLNSLIPFTVIAGLLLYCWIAVHSVTGLWAWAVAYGAFAACIQSLFPAALTSLTTDPKKQGVRTGMGFGVAGFAVLTGPPLAGQLIQMSPPGTFLYAQLFAGTSMFISFGTLIAARYKKAGGALRAKV